MSITSLALQNVKKCIERQLRYLDHETQVWLLEQIAKFIEHKLSELKQP